MGRPRNDARLERVRASITNNDDSRLTEEDKVYRDELLSAFDLLMSEEHTERSLLSALVAQFNISLGTALRRLQDAKHAFSDLLPGNRITDAHRLIMQCEADLQEANAITDPKERLEVKDRIRNTLIKLRGLDKPDDGIDPSAYEPSKMVVSMPPALNSALLKLVGQGFVNLSNQVQLPAAEFTEIPDADVVTDQAGTA